MLKKKGGDEKRDIKAKKPLKKVFIFHSLLYVERVVCFRTCVKFVLKTFFPIELGAVISFGNYRANVSCLPTYRIASGRVILAVWVIRLLKKKGRNKNKNELDSFCKWRDDVLVSFQFQFELVLLSRELLLLFKKKINFKSGVRKILDASLNLNDLYTRRGCTDEMSKQGSIFFYFLFSGGLWE